MIPKLLIMNPVVIYRSIILVPVFYILMIVTIANNEDVGEDTNTAEDQGLMVHAEQEDEMFEIGDKFAKDPKFEIVFARKRSKINENLLP